LEEGKDAQLEAAIAPQLTVPKDSDKSLQLLDDAGRGGQ